MPAVLLLVSALAGCAGAGPVPSSGSSSAPRFDPPTTFAAESRVLDSFSPESVVWENRFFTVEREHPSDDRYVSKLTGADLLTGGPLWSVTAQSRIPNEASRPVIATIGGRTLVLAAFAGEIKGEGTEPVTTAIELVAVDAATGRTAWTAMVPLTRDSQWNDGQDLTVVGADDDAIVVRSGTELDLVRTVVIDPATRQVRWIAELRAESYTAGRIATVTGTAIPDKLQVWEASSRRELWNMPLDSSGFTNVHPLGPTLLGVSTGRPTLAGGRPLELRDAATGQVRATLVELTDLSGPVCVYDGRSVVVCRTSELTDKPALVAYDAETHEELWKLPDGGRTGIRLSTAWHGAVYGLTGNGPVILDARSGADRETRPGIAPQIVTPYGGLATVEGTNQVQAFHHATS